MTENESPDIKQAFVGPREIQLKEFEFDSLDTQKARHFPKVLDIQQLNTGRLDDKLKLKLNSLKETQFLQGIQAEPCCESQLENLNLKNIEENVKQLGETLETSVENAFPEGFALAGHLVIGSTAVREVASFVQINALSFVISPLVGGLFGFVYYQIILCFANPEIKKNPLASTFFLMLTCLLNSFALGALGLILFNIVFNLSFGIPVYTRFAFLNTTFFSTHVLNIMEKLNDIMKKLPLNKLPLIHLASVSTTVLSYRLQS